MSKTQYEIKVPDFGGGDTSAEVIELLISIGDTIKENDTLLVLETEKSAFDVPSEVNGIVKEIYISLGDEIKHGDLIATVEVSELNGNVSTLNKSIVTTDQVKTNQVKEAVKNQQQKAALSHSTFPTTLPNESTHSLAQVMNTVHFSDLNRSIYAGPAVRKLARQMGVNLSQVQGTGKRQRIVKDDLLAYVKKQLMQKQSTINLPDIDFAQFGQISQRALTKLEMATVQNMQRSWQVIPHVTHFDDVDITALDKYRKQLNQKEPATKLSLLAFIIKSLVETLKQMPQFNTSLSQDTQQLIQKSYYHIGVAVDTVYGLLVPVVRDVDQLSVKQIAEQIKQLADKAKNKKLTPKEMQGASMTVTSLGNIGGKAFTPIINWPEVAILGVSQSYIQAIWQTNQFEPRLVLPLSLSYDHRVINGADAARFMNVLKQLLMEIR